MILNLILVFLCSFIAGMSFSTGRNITGSLNLLAAALNAYCVVKDFIG